MDSYSAFSSQILINGGRAEQPAFKYMQARFDRQASDPHIFVWESNSLPAPSPILLHSTFAEKKHSNSI